MPVQDSGELTVVPGNTTQFHYDGDALVGEYVNGAMTRRYVHGDSIDEPLVQYNHTGTGLGREPPIVRSDDGVIT